MSLTVLDKSTLILDGRKAVNAYADLYAALIEVRVRETITGASTATLRVVDPKGTIRTSGLLASGVTCLIDGAGFELVHVGRSTRGDLSMEFEDMAVAALRKHKTYRKAAANTVTRAAFCQLLIREEPWIKVNAAPGTVALVELARGSADSTAVAVSAGGSAGGFGTQALDPAAAKAAILASSGTGSSKVKTASKKDRQIAAGAAEPENTWDACSRIMGEIGWRTFSVRGAVSLAPDSWILSKGTPYALTETSPGVEQVDWDFDIGKPAATANLTVRCGTTTSFPVGSRVTLSGEGPADGDWLVETIERSDRSPQATVSLIRPEPALPEPAVDETAANLGLGGFGDIAGGTSGVVFGAGTPSVNVLVEGFVQQALQQQGRQYVWGATGPTTFDCSGLVMWSANRAGIKGFGRTVGNQLDICRRAGTLMSVEQAIATRGALLVHGPNTHIAISLGNGKTMEAKGRAYGVGIFEARGRGWTTGAWVPGIAVSAGSSRDGRAS